MGRRREHSEAPPSPLSQALFAIAFTAAALAFGYSARSYWEGGTQAAVAHLVDTEEAIHEDDEGRQTRLYTLTYEYEVGEETYSFEETRTAYQPRPEVVVARYWDHEPSQVFRSGSALRGALWRASGGVCCGLLGLCSLFGIPLTMHQRDRMRRGLPAEPERGAQPKAWSRGERVLTLVAFGGLTLLCGAAVWGGYRLAHLKPEVAVRHGAFLYGVARPQGYEAVVLDRGPSGEGDRTVRVKLAFEPREGARIPLRALVDQPGWYEGDDYPGFRKGLGWTGVVLGVLGVLLFGFLTLVVASGPSAEASESA